VVRVTNVERLELQVVTRGTEAAAAELGKVERAETGVATAAKTATKESATAWDDYQRKLNAAATKMTTAIDKTIAIYEQFGPAAAAGQAEALAEVEKGNARLVAAFTSGGEAMVAAMRSSLSGLPAVVTAQYAAAAAAAERGSAKVGAASAATHAATPGLKSAAEKLAGGAGVSGLLGGLGATAGIMAGYELTTNAIENASSANEAKNLLNRLAPGLAARVEGMDTAKLFGMSKGQAMENLTGLVSQFRQAGMNPQQASDAALKALQGAADIGSFRNIDPGQVLTSFQAGISGQTRALRPLGIYTTAAQNQARAAQMFNLGKGQKPTSSQLLAANWQAISQSQGYEQASGDYSRTLAYSFANQQRTTMADISDRLEKIGESLLPLAEQGLQFFDWMLHTVGPLLIPVLKLLGGAVSAANTGAQALGAVGGQVSTAVGADVANLGRGGSSITNPWSWQQYASFRDQGGAAGARKVIQNYLLSGVHGVWNAGKSIWHWAFGGGGDTSTEPNEPLAIPAGSATDEPGNARGGVLGGWSPGIDNMLVPLSGGEGILTPETVAMLGGGNAINAMNLAGLRKRGGYANGIGAAQVTAGMLGGRAGASSAVISGIFAPGGGAIPAATTGSSSSGSGVGRWASDVRTAMTMRGLNPGGPDFQRIMNQIQLESSGNPNAINLTDSNARKGTPSIGLLQVIQPTFDHYAYPGYSANIRDPMSNILASIGYMLGRYGSVQGAIGAGGTGPYDDGGWLKPGSTAVSALDKPEPVLTPDQWDTARKAIEHAASGVTVSIGSIEITVGAGGVSGSDLASTVRDGLADAIATRVNRSNDRRL
jgi:hypothetical protein